MVSPSSKYFSTLSHSPENSLSTLTLPSVRLKDSGNYSCQPPSLSLQRAVVILHVLQEQKEQELLVQETFSGADQHRPSLAFWGVVGYGLSVGGVIMNR